MSDIPVSDASSVPSTLPDGETAPSPLDALQRERDELYDRLLRKTAEFDNFKKRTERERREFAEWAAAELHRRRARRGGRLRARAGRGRAA